MTPDVTSNGVIAQSSNGKDTDQGEAVAEYTLECVRAVGVNLADISSDLKVYKLKVGATFELSHEAPIFELLSKDPHWRAFTSRTHCRLTLSELGTRGWSKGNGIWVRTPPVCSLLVENVGDNVVFMCDDRISKGSKAVIKDGSSLSFPSIVDGVVDNHFLVFQFRHGSQYTSQPSLPVVHRDASHQTAEAVVLECVEAAGCKLDRVPAGFKIIALRFGVTVELGRKHQTLIFERLLKEAPQYLNFISQTQCRIRFGCGHLQCSSEKKCCVENIGEHDIYINDEVVKQGDNVELGKGGFLVFSAPDCSCFLKFRFRQANEARRLPSSFSPAMRARPKIDRKLTSLLRGLGNKSVAGKPDDAALAELKADMATWRQLHGKEIARRLVRVAWDFCHCNYFEPQQLHPSVQALLRPFVGDLSLEQLDHNTLALLSTFDQVPVIEGTERANRNGFVDASIRADLTMSVGAPPFQVIGWRTLKQLQYIPRSSEGFTVTLQDILQDRLSREEPLLCPKGNPVLQVYMVSHTWCSKAHQPGGKIYPELAHPDDENCTKAKSLIAFGEYTYEQFGREVFFWIDYCCIDQDDVRAGVRSLPLYVCCCSSFLVLYSVGYETRAWTLLEQCMFAGVGTKPAITALSVDGSFFPDMKLGADGKETRRALVDPALGVLSDEVDRELIRYLTQLAQNLWASSWIDSSSYWSGDANTLFFDNAVPKQGPGLKCTHELSFGETEVLVRRLELTAAGIRVVT
eukprot:TRINITY_DN19360_c0_g3_i1.p1 TRINITY_DN19360_c0_g3~~TRINITY_DN19360_c0_g3_i1.p1  ORF type:complete len:745 (+),score=63.99 TRINITY_DN19360_c0_g3_i1:110-2344(+)